MFRIGVQSSLIFYGLGQIETILDAYFSVLTGSFNVIIEGLIIWMMNLLACRVGNYFDNKPGEKSISRTCNSNKRIHDHDLSKNSHAILSAVKSQMSDNDSVNNADAQGQIIEVYDGP
eukprot:Awhi_evm1s11278